jgi:pimeloyl-ACP methyl ester carboxylesterase
MTLRRSTIALGGLLLLASAGTVYQVIGRASDIRHFPEPGRSVDIGGRHMQLYCTGHGTPTVILEAGLGGLLDSWRSVRPSIAAFTRVCSYDRAGYGASDAGPMPRTASAIAADLHELLRRGGEQSPYVLAGHSFGGYIVRVFNGLYPDDVGGLVLVDSPQEDQFGILPPAWAAASAALLRRYRVQARWAPLYIGLGIARIQLRFQGAAPHTFLILQPRYLRARASEMESMAVSAEEARAAGHISDKPLIVLTAGHSLDDASQRIWEQQVQLHLASLSVRGRQVVVPGSTHNMPADRPDAIVDAVRQLAQYSSSNPNSKTGN